MILLWLKNSPSILVFTNIPLTEIIPDLYAECSHILSDKTKKYFKNREFESHYFSFYGLEACINAGEKSHSDIIKEFDEKKYEIFKYIHEKIGLKNFFKNIDAGCGSLCLIEDKTGLMETLRKNGMPW